MISNPTNFNHVAHMGPGDGMQVLMDLPLVRAWSGQPRICRVCHTAACNDRLGTPMPSRRLDG